MVVYNTYLAKVNKTRKILRADMTDENGMKTQIATLYSSLQLYFFIKFTKLHLLIL
jgi:hypothetical protein